MFVEINLLAKVPKNMAFMSEFSASRSCTNSRENSLDLKLN